MTESSADPDLSAADELVRAVYDGAFDRVHRDIQDILKDPVFEPHADLTLAEAGRLAYRRSRVVHAKLERPRELLRDPLRLFALAEWPALLDVSTFSLLMVHYNLCLGTVVEHGGDRPELDGHLRELDDLTSFGPFMATELGYGNNVAALATEAVYDPERDEFVLDTPNPLAQKFMSYSGFEDIPKIAVVMARTRVAGRDHGVRPFLVRISDAKGLCEGVHAAPCPDKPVQGLDNGLTWFDGVRVPRRQLLGDTGEVVDGELQLGGGNQRQIFLRSMSRIQPGRICVSSAAVAAGKASVFIALRYARQRLTNAPGRPEMPAMEYRSHHLPLLSALARVYAMAFLLNKIKRAYLADGGEVSIDLGISIAVTKALTTWEMTDVVGVCRERCGAQGMFSVNRIADYVSLLQGLVTAEGDNQVLIATAARQLLARPDDGDAAAAGGADLREPAGQVRLLRQRESLLRQEVQDELADESRHRAYFAAWNSVTAEALAMARTRGVRTALEEFAAAAGECRAEDSREALGQLALLYGLNEIGADCGWYLARGLISKEQARAIPGAVDALCDQLLPRVPLLLEGFALTPELLRAPIAADDYVAAFSARASARPGR